MALQFGALNVRVILALQDEIVQLEEQLDAMDKAFGRKNLEIVHPKPDTINNGTFRHVVMMERIVIS